MHFHVIHFRERWPRPENHLDCRRCTECGVTVHGKEGQSAHIEWHTRLAETLNDLGEHVNEVEFAGQPMVWTAAVDEMDGETEAVEAS